MARAQAALADAEAALAAARHIEAQTSIYAPIDGNHLHHGRRSLGITPKPENCCFRWPTCTIERVRAYFDEPDLGRLAIGQKVIIRWDAKPGREWHGHIARLPVTVVTYTTRNVGEVLVDHRRRRKTVCCPIPMSPLR